MPNRIDDNEFTDTAWRHRLSTVALFGTIRLLTRFLFEIVTRIAILQSIQIRLIALLEENLIVSRLFQL
jgi:hypothetical protein